MNAPYDSLIEAYLDGTLSGDELRRFEARLRTDEALRDEVELAQRIDASLRARFEPAAIPFELNGSPGAADEVPRGEAAPGVPSAQSMSRSLRWRRIGVIAGIAAGVLLAAILVLRFGGVGGGPSVQTGTQLERLYAKYRSEGWTPAWVCEDDAEFIAAVADRLGQGLLIEDEAIAGEPELTVLGWAYGEDVSSYEVIITDRTMVLLTKVDGRGVVALVDRADRETRRLRVPEGELTLHRRELGDLVIYELTPLDGPHLLERFFVP